MHEIHVESMVLSESFQVAVMIEKLPLPWKEFKNYLKHKRKEIELEGLIVRWRTEEDNRVFETKVWMLSMTSKANVVDQVQKTNKKRKYNNNDFRGVNNKRFKRNCYICN